MAETVAWIDADGGSTALEVEWNTTARFAPPVAFEEEGIPGESGLRLRAARHLAREFVLPLWISAGSESALRTALRDLVYKMDATRGDGKIRITSPVGDEREINCRYAAGLELDEKLGDTSGPTVQRAPVMFKAHDPYWYAVADTTVTYTTGTPPTFFPFFPMNLAGSEVFASASVTNTGDLSAWPVWTVTGPGQTIVLRNLTTSKLLTLQVTLGIGETVVIDTRPGAKTVIKGDGTNLFLYLATTTSFWPLLKGSNSIQIEMASATVQSSVQLAYRLRYLSP